MVVIDTNIICRFLLKDDPTLYKKAQSIITHQDIYLDAIIIAETIWVLTKLYHLPKADVIEKIRDLLFFAKSTLKEKQLINQTLSIYYSHPISFVDAWLIATCQHYQVPLAIFDKKLVKLAHDSSRIASN